MKIRDKMKGELFDDGASRLTTTTITGMKVHGIQNTTNTSAHVPTVSRIVQCVSSRVYGRYCIDVILKCLPAIPVRTLAVT